MNVRTTNSSWRGGMLAAAGAIVFTFVAVPLVANAEPVCACEETTTVPETVPETTAPETTPAPTTAAPETTPAPTTPAPTASVGGVTVAPVLRAQELPPTGGSTRPLVVIGVGSVAAGAVALTLVARRRATSPN